MGDQLAWLLNSVSLGVVYLLESNIWLGVKDSKTKFDASRSTVFFVEDARTSRIKSFAHDLVLLQLQHPG
jgi:hypothetical protein